MKKWIVVALLALTVGGCAMIVTGDEISPGANRLGVANEGEEAMEPEQSP